MLRPPNTQSSNEIQWSVYSDHYDAMCSVNPSYDSMLSLVEQKLKPLDLTSSSKVLDIGAGTGNLIMRLAKKAPNSSFVHLDIDAGMINKAREKYRDHSITNVELVHSSFLDWEMTNAAFDVIVSTNALYAIHPHQEALNRMRDLLAPGGKLILVDFGRKQNTNDWLFYIIKNSILNYGWRRTYRIVKDNWEAARQNRRTTSAQTEGHYWLHSTLEFVAALEESDFEIIEVDSCYRGYSDIAVCRPVK